MGAGTLAAASPPALWVAVAFVVAAGAGNGAAVVCNVLLVQRGAPDRLRGRVFGVLMGVSYGALGLGIVAAGPFTNAYGERAVWIAAAGLCAVGAAAAFVLLRREVA